jgi:DNA repair protein RecN (Recombination protein N)
MTALTGETGAGKSILIDALGLVLGDKPDPGLIRAGCERAEIAATFDLRSSPEAGSWLCDQELDDGGECLIRRLLVRAGRSRAYVNGRPVTAAQLQALGERLVDIHGQHAHQSLLRPGAQRALLDGFGGHADIAADVARRYREFRRLDERLGRLHERREERAERMDHLRYQVDELDALGLEPHEIDDLDREQKRLANLGELQLTAGRLLDMLYDRESSAHDELSRSVSDLDTLCAFDEGLAETRELVEGAAIQVEEAAANLRQYVSELVLDSAAVDRVETRLSQIHDLARKFRVLPAQLPETLAALSGELETLQNEDLALGTLVQECDAARQSFLAQAGKLSALRREAAERLSIAVTTSLQGLGMAGAHFVARITELDADAGGPHGLDRVELMVSANPGQPLQPLAKVASGGELSRISLCIQVAGIECASVPTLVFDEVDVGIGGSVAEVVGRLLRTLGTKRQVLCVTHLPQVASQAHSHLQVHKFSRDGETFTGIASLKGEQRVGEIARMLGGTEITEKTLAHAREMTGRSQAEECESTRG